MLRQQAIEEYAQAQKLGLREAKELTAAGKSPYPAILDTLLPETLSDTYQDIGLVEIPAELIVGTKTAGRISAFTATFRPLLEDDSEFAQKWIHLCQAHLSDEGIREPVLCYEYLGKFYVQEGNKRVSVLRHFDAPRIPGNVRRILPAKTEDPEILAYYEFIDFYKCAKLYTFQFRQPGQYAKLLSALGKEPGEEWTERERRTVSAYYQYFRDAYQSLGNVAQNMSTEEALLKWLKVYPFKELGQLSDPELKKTISSLWEGISADAEEPPVQVKTAPVASESKANLLTRLIGATPDHLDVAFVHRHDPQQSAWIKGHDQGSLYLQEALGDKVTVRSYFHADTQQQAEDLIEQAVEEGADVVFTTTPQLSRATLRAAVKYPKVRFLNCSVATPYSCIRTYYSRIYEAKFITGAIAGAMATNDRIGYVGAYPIFGVPASINAFALGAQMTNPRATVELRWSCQQTNPVMEFIRDGIRVISNRDIPTQDQKYLSFGEYGTYLVGDNGSLTAMAAPCWLWGKFYELVVRTILDGTWEQGKDAQQPLNYWWGMDSDVIDVEFSENLPEGVLSLAQTLRQGIRTGTVDPFQRRIVAQDGTVMNDGTQHFTPDMLLHMDWLCENVVGSIPQFEELLPMAQPMVRELGVYRDLIPPEKEADAL